MLGNKGSRDLSEIVSFFAIMLFLIAFIAIFSIPDFIKEKQETIKVENQIYSKENIFVIEALLSTPISSDQEFSDLVNLWLVDKQTYGVQLTNELRNIIYPVYGSCYGFKIDTFEIGSLDNDKKSCIPYPNYGNEIEVCLDISKFDEKLAKGEESKCW